MNKIYRSKDDAMIAGVCGGIAEAFDIDSTVVRLIVITLVLLTDGIMFVLYLLAWAIIPERGETKDTAKDLKKSITEAGKNFEKSVNDLEHKLDKSTFSLWLAGGLIFIGVFLLIKPFLPTWIDPKQLLLAGGLIVCGLLVLDAYNKRSKNDQK